MISKLTHLNKWQTLCIALIVSGLCTISLLTVGSKHAYAYPADARLVGDQNLCMNDTNHGVWGGGWVSETSISYTPGGGPVPVTLVATVCNRSVNQTIYLDDHYFGNTKLLDTDNTTVLASNVLTYTDPVNPWVVRTLTNNPPGNKFQGTWAVAATGLQPFCVGVPATNPSCFQSIQRTVLLDLSSITKSGTYYLLVDGFGSVKSAVGQICSPPGNADAGHPSGSPSPICTPTNDPSSGSYPITVIVTTPSSDIKSLDSASCSTGINGWAFDPDFTPAKLAVQLYVDRVPDATAPDATVTANQFGPPIDPGNGSMSGANGYGFSFTNQVFDHRDAFTHNYYIRLKGVNGAGNPDGIDITLAPRVILPCVTADCTVNTNVTGPIKQNNQFSVSSQLNYPSGSSPNLIGSKGLQLLNPTTTATINITPPAGAPTNYTVPFPPAGPPSFVNTSSTPLITATQLGFYTYKITYSDPRPGFVTVSCNGQIQVVNYTTPYLGVFGGDIFAGGGFASCNTPPGGGNIIGSLNGSNVGAGSQLGAFATGTISSFNSAELAAPLPSSLLSFANTGAPPGNFATGNCITAYPMATSGTAPGPNPVTLSASGTYYTTTDLTVGAVTLGKGEHITVYVNGGNLTISGPITYDTITQPWANAADVPSITFIVSGNIYIDHSIGQLDGTYVAEPNGATGGTIDTCNNYGLTDLTPPSNNVYTNCGKQLVVNGSFVAKHIDWLRSYGDASKATLGENPYPGAATHDCQSPAVPPQTTTCAAEVIIDGPETYIGQSGSNSPTANYDYFTSLPPVL